MTCKVSRRMTWYFSKGTITATWRLNASHYSWIIRNTPTSQEYSVKLAENAFAELRRNLASGNISLNTPRNQATVHWYESRAASYHTFYSGVKVSESALTQSTPVAILQSWQHWFFLHLNPFKESSPRSIVSQYLNRGKSTRHPSFNSIEWQETTRHTDINADLMRNYGAVASPQRSGHISEFPYVKFREKHADATIVFSVQISKLQKISRS